MLVPITVAQKSYTHGFGFRTMRQCVRNEMCVSMSVLYVDGGLWLCGMFYVMGGQRQPDRVGYRTLAMTSLVGSEEIEFHVVAKHLYLYSTMTQL